MVNHLGTGFFGQSPLVCLTDFFSALSETVSRVASSMERVFEGIEKLLLQGSSHQHVSASTLEATMGWKHSLAVAFLVAAVCACNPPSESGLAPIPDGLVVLTFDDGNKSDISFVALKLVEYGFGASFYITEGLGYEDDPNKERYVSWQDVRQLHELGFEVGNHTGSHPDMTKLSKDEIRSNLELIEQRCEQYGIPRPVTFVYPGWRHSLPVVEVLAERQYIFARRGVSPEYPDAGNGARGLPYDPAQDHPFLIPTTGYAGPEWGFEDLVWAVHQAKDGKIAVLTFHGVPAVQHPWVHTDPEDFIRYMDYLKEQGCTVIAMRDLLRYVDPNVGPDDPYAPIRNRLAKAE